MNRSFLSALTCAIVSACSHQLGVSPGSDASTRAPKTLEAAAKAYQRVAALNDTLTYVIKTPSGVQAPKTLEIRLGAGRDVAVKDALFEVVAFDRTLYLTKGDAPGKYVAQPYTGDFARSLEAIVDAQGWPFEPIQIAMRLGKNQDGWLQGLRFGQLGPLKISGYEEKSIDGRSVEVVHLIAENGGIEADFDSTTQEKRQGCQIFSVTGIDDAMFARSRR